MPRQYRTGFRDEMVRRMLTGEPVLTICSDTGVPEQTLHRWKHQALIDADLPPINVPERLLVLGCCGASFA